MEFLLDKFLQYFSIDFQANLVIKILLILNLQISGFFELKLKSPNFSGLFKHILREWSKKRLLGVN